MGVLNSVFAFSVFAALQLSLGRFVHYLILLCVTHVVGVLEAFTVQRYYVFESRGPWLPELARFWSVYLGAAAVNIPLLLFFVEVVRIPVLPAQLGTLALLALASYAAHRSFTFSPGDRAAHEPERSHKARKFSWSR